MRRLTDLASAILLVTVPAVIALGSIAMGAMHAGSTHRHAWPYGTAALYERACAKLAGGGSSCSCQAGALQDRVAWGALAVDYGPAGRAEGAAAGRAARARCGGPPVAAVMLRVRRDRFLE